MNRRAQLIATAIIAAVLVLAAGALILSPRFRPAAPAGTHAGLAPPAEVLLQGAGKEAQEARSRGHNDPHGTAPTRLHSATSLPPGTSGASSLPSAPSGNGGERESLAPAQPPPPWPNVRVDQTLYAPEETAIVIDPTNPNRMVAAAQGFGAYYFRSSDGGASWAEGSIQDQYDLGDPTLAVDANGWIYYGYIGTFQHSGIFVTRSTDGGVTWRPGVPVIEHNSGAPFEDKEYPECDRTNGPWAGSLYLGWTQFDAYNSASPTDSSRIFFSYSRDQATTFAEPVRVGDRGGDCIDSDNTVEGAVPTVGPDGTVYLAWAGPRGIEFDRSTNGGATWGADRVLSDLPGGWDFAVSGIYRVNGLPATRVDRSIGPYSGRVFVMWSDQRNGDTDVFLIHSDDRGGHWSPRLRVNGDPVGNGRDQFFPWMDVDPVTGYVFIAYYDRRATTGTATEVWMAVSTDGGSTFTEQRISQSPFTPSPSVFFGDYIGIAAYGGRVRPCWMRLDGNFMSAWTALIEYNPADVREPEGLRLTVLPNPARNSAQIFASGQTSAAGLAGPLAVYAVDGRLVRTLPSTAQRGPGVVASWDLQDEGGRAVPAGVYLVRSARGAATRVVVAR